MSNSVQCFLEVSNLNSQIKDFFRKIEINSAYSFKNINDLEVEYITDCLNFDELLDLSYQTESNIAITYYDTSLGYLRRKVFSHGYLISDVYTQFSMDIESTIYEKSNTDNFKEELNNYLNENGIKNSNFPKIGDYIKVNDSICSDVDILDWLEEQPTNKFKVTHLELESNGIWIEGCEYRIELNEIISI